MNLTKIYEFPVEFRINFWHKFNRYENELLRKLLEREVITIFAHGTEGPNYFKLEKGEDMNIIIHTIAAVSTGLSWQLNFRGSVSSFPTHMEAMKDISGWLDLYHKIGSFKVLKNENG